VICARTVIDLARKHHEVEPATRDEELFERPCVAALRALDRRRVVMETRQYQVIEICRAFRVPPHMIQMLDRSTFNNIEVQGTEFVQHCLLPHLKRWEAAISRDLIVDDEKYFAEHSVSGLLRGDHASRSAYYVSALQNGWMTVNEIRELENLNPIGPQGDQHFIQLNMTTLEKAGEPADGTPEDDAEDTTTAQEDTPDGT
jgi:hypothetical protein